MWTGFDGQNAWCICITTFRRSGKSIFFLHALRVDMIWYLSEVRFDLNEKRSHKRSSNDSNRTRGPGEQTASPLYVRRTVVHHTAEIRSRDPRCGVIERSRTPVKVLGAIVVGVGRETLNRSKRPFWSHTSREPNFCRRKPAPVEEQGKRVSCSGPRALHGI
jgi:hypothetical protein